MEFEINWLALVAAAFSTIFIGFFWYGPLFGKAWMRETGITEEQAKKSNMILLLGLSVVFGFFIAIQLWGLVFTGGAPGHEHGLDPYVTFKHGAFHGALLALFVVLPVLGTIALYEQKSWRYVAINVGYWLVTFSVMGGIINAWPA
ncbi:DUF1761 domain-containing protein [Croceiramulus getboli]|nr:DUF1761 domain-containing protein [Flavobacteriaceae bacterium YJPT1-3]